MVERGSTRHSPRVDDELEGEAAAEGEPKPGAVVSVDEVELRSLLATSLRPSAFPAERDRLLEVAREEQAEDGVLEWLSALPAAVTFPNVQSVWEALGGAHESREHSLGAGVPAEQPTASPAAPSDSGSLIDRGVRVALAGAAVVVGLTIEAVRAVLRKR
jgi:hypothetical protein